jgi:heptosyltransferase-3
MGDCVISDISFKYGPSPTFLIVCFRFIGDVLVTTPLAYSIKQAIPDAVIDYLVFQGTDKVLAKNPFIRNVLVVPRDRSNVKVLFSLWKKYDVALAAYPSDRTIVASAIIGKKSVGFIYNNSADFWKQVVLGTNVIYNHSMHVVWNMLSLLEPLGIPMLPRISMGYDKSDISFARRQITTIHYVLIHPYSMKQYKYWPAQHWGELAYLIQEHTGCSAVFTETPAREDKAYLKEILSHSPDTVTTFACNLNQFAAALENCTAYIGVDTGATHIAAAQNVRVFALYGPSWTKYWAPWPNDTKDNSPFDRNRGIQKVSNVTVIQKDWECVPCNQETCRISSCNKTECLEKMSVEEVFYVLREELG